MTDGTILYEANDRVAWITLNRPNKLNAISPNLWGELKNALATADRDRDVRVIVFKGAGERAFSVGGDLGREAEKRDQRQILEDWNSLIQSVWNCSKPIIAMINGYCLAGAMDLALMCDIRYCSDDTQFGLVQIRFGVGLLALPAMSWVVGQRCRELLYTGDAFDAQEAYRLGLVSRVFPKDQLEKEVTRIAMRMSRVAMPTLKWNKKALDNTLLSAGFDSAMRYSLEACHIVENSETEFKHFHELSRTDVKAAVQWRDSIFAPFESETSTLSGLTKGKQKKSAK